MKNIDLAGVLIVSLLVNPGAKTYPFGYFGPRSGTGVQPGAPDALASNPSGQSALLSTLLSQYAQAAVSGVGQALSGIAINANRLSAAAQPFLSTDTNSLLNARAVTVGSPAMQATVQSGATIQTFQVGVQNLATAQQNTGALLTAAAINGAQTGTNTFQVTVGTKQTTLSVLVGASDTNNTVLNNVASAINGAGLGLTAQVQTNQGGAQLVVTGNQTGTANAFSLKDVTGNLVASTGAAAVTTSAGDAQISVNGVQYTSDTNQLSLDNANLSLTVNAVTAPSTVTVTVGSTAERVADSVQTLVRAANQYQPYYRASKAYLDRMVDLNPILKGVDLQTLGLTQNPEQTLSLDRSKLITSLQSNFARVSDALVGIWGLASTLNSQAQFVLNQPSSSLASFAAASGTSVVSSVSQKIMASSLIGLFLNVRL